MPKQNHGTKAQIVLISDMLLEKNNNVVSDGLQTSMYSKNDSAMIEKVYIIWICFVSGGKGTTIAPALGRSLCRRLIVV